MIDTLRQLNVFLGASSFFLLCYRTPAIVQRLASKRLFFALAAFPVLVCFGSVQALAQHAPHGPVTPCFTVAYLALNTFLTCLPPQLRGGSDAGD